LQNDPILSDAKSEEYILVRIAVFTAVTTKNADFWDATTCCSLRTDVSEEIIASIFRVTRIDELGTTLGETSNYRSMLWLLVTSNVLPSSSILVTLMMEAIGFSEKWVLTRAIRRNIPASGIFVVAAVKTSNHT
jgi:hypothetical protein